MNVKGQVSAKNRNEDTEGSHAPSADGPTIHVAPSGALSIELSELVPYLLPTEKEVRGYIKEARSNIGSQE